jgi:sugar/nucleoside kinase (ribokinase family)
MTGPDVVCYGELGADNIIQVPHLPTPELAAFPTSDTYHIGGAAANTAVWLANWGVPVRLAGNALGSDALGDDLKGRFGRWPALDVTSVQWLPDGATPFCRILVTPDGERTILVFGYPQTIKTPLTPSMIEGARILALDLYGGEERTDAARLAHAEGLTIVVSDLVDPSHPVCPLASVIILSSAYLVAARPGVDPERHAASLRDVAGATVILTAGRGLVLVLTADGPAFCVRPEAVPAVDATGAGDAFRAGLIYGMLEAWPLEQSVRCACAAGARKVGHLGGASHPAPIEAVEAAARRLSSEPVPDPA